MLIVAQLVSKIPAFYGIPIFVIVFTRVMDVFFRHCLQTGSGAHTAYFSVGTGGSFPGSKADYAWSCTSTHQYVFMTLCLIKQGTCIHSVIRCEAQGQLRVYLAEDFRGFPYSLQGNTRVVS